MRRAAKTDRNHASIINLLRDLGFTVLSLHRVGAGAPDILAGRNKKNFLIEIKDGEKPPSQRKLNDLQQMFHDSWRGQVCVLSNVDEVVSFSKYA